MDYKKYSLENLENWIHDAMSAGEASPQEIYDTIHKVVEENYYIYKEQTAKAYELLSLLNGNGKGHIEAYDDYVKEVLSEKEYYEPSMPPWGHSDLEYMIHNKESLSCDKDDSSPECKKSWNDFWEQSYLSGVTDTPKQAEELRAEIENIRKSGGFDWTPAQDKVKKWVLPTQVDGLTGDVIVNLPDDLLERAGLKEGDLIEWIDRKDGSFEMRKVNGTK
jgi:hypothetical protein